MRGFGRAGSMGARNFRTIRTILRENGHVFEKAELAETAELGRFLAWRNLDELTGVGDCWSRKCRRR